MRAARRAEEKNHVLEEEEEKHASSSPVPVHSLAMLSLWKGENATRVVRELWAAEHARPISYSKPVDQGTALKARVKGARWDGFPAC